MTAISTEFAAIASRVATLQARLGVARPPVVAGASPAGTGVASVRSFDSVLETAMVGAGRPAPTGSGGGATFRPLFERAGAAHGVDPRLLEAVASVESGFDPTAVSPAGAEGLMQLMPATADGLGVSNSFDPAQAVDGAARLLRSHLDRYGSVELALAAYNAGPGAVNRYGGIPPYAETQAYVRRVMTQYGGTS